MCAKGYVRQYISGSNKYFMSTMTLDEIHIRTHENDDV